MEDRMSEPKWALIYEAIGHDEANVIRSFLEAEGIEVQVLQEAAGSSFPVTFGPLAYVQIYVPQEKEADARSLLENFKE
jgi:hypothetical protein